MQTIGERLEEARKRKGISVREAAETTKIRGDYLQKFEANTFQIDLPPLYIRGFLRSYARYLELDPERIVNDYNELLAEGKPVSRRETREVYGRVDFAEGARAKEPVEPAPANRAPQDQAMLLKFGLLGGGAVVLVVIIILLFKVIFSGSPAKPSPAAQPAAQQSSALPADPAQTLTLTATDPTRVKVVQDSDGTVLFNGALSRGESKSLRKQGKLLITVEAGKNLRMEVNGRNYAVPVDNYGRFGLD
ncbi:MAG: RodZ domain-containing protein [Lacunisphaera sp.]